MSKIPDNFIGFSELEACQHCRLRYEGSCTTPTVQIVEEGEPPYMIKCMDYDFLDHDEEAAEREHQEQGEEAEHQAYKQWTRS